jgi:hypothetical protein
MGKNKVEDEVQNKQIIFRDYVIGYPRETDLYICTADTIKLHVPQGSKSVLVKNMYLSCDPTMQFLMRKDESPLSGSYKYIPAGSVSDVLNINILKLKLLIYFWLHCIFVLLTSYKLEILDPNFHNSTFGSLTLVHFCKKLISSSTDFDQVNIYTHGQ